MAAAGLGVSVDGLGVSVAAAAAAAAGRIVAVETAVAVAVAVAIPVVANESVLAAGSYLKSTMEHLARGFACGILARGGIRLVVVAELPQAAMEWASSLCSYAAGHSHLLGCGGELAAGLASHFEQHVLQSRGLPRQHADILWLQRHPLY